MTVNGVGNATDCKRSDSIGGNMQMDSISRNLKNQIANAQKKLQELSSNQELSLTAIVLSFHKGNGFLSGKRLIAERVARFFFYVYNII